MSTSLLFELLIVRKLAPITSNLSNWTVPALGLGTSVVPGVAPWGVTGVGPAVGAGGVPVPVTTAWGALVYMTGLSVGFGVG